ncbi:glycosyltransferase family 4 protein [Desmonostoc muscorum LEGE 12446]|uniref:Glycosyltransferase family 4 protein n=1 Tax=Desmonostoc muscorum LEGE 12446 TaxID=1828758 RepID=A0A8J6ZQQ7_DESMC|nr:glycosyltransferase family 1 protein [Desmonostoc muscorum]MCF2148988.1 glycosyltransferase family 4 protein [Desmonostoc muscorum LEGE 12446]
MNLIAYIHPIRTYVPCTGIGRHMNQMLLGLAERSGVELELLFFKQWLGSDGKLDPLSPLRELPKRTFPTVENSTERTWKLLGYPRVDKYLPDQADWLYAPMETYIPVSKCPVAVTIHDIQAFETNLPWSHTWHHRFFRYKWERWVRRALCECRVVFTVSEFSRQRMVELLGADPQKIVVVGNGVEQSFFDIASANPADWKSPVEAPYIIIVGGLRQKKGGDDVLAVADSLRQRKSNLHIVVAGASEAAYVEAVKAHSHVTLLGKVPDEDLPRLMRGASSFLFLSPYEGFGIPALEAMAAGTPAIVANKASLPEVVGDAGIVVNPEATDEIVDVLIELDRNSHLRKKYIQLGKKHAAQYTWSRCVDGLITTFKQFA